jgi:biopolymer transport protein TolQ
MQGSVVDQVPLGGVIPHDMSIFGLFVQADVVVKIVMLILLLASFWSWAIIFDKLMRLRRLRREASSFEESFWSGGSRRCASGGGARPRASSAPTRCAPASRTGSSG